MMAKKSKTKMRIPSCTICQTQYNDDSHAPLLLQCGHCFCKHCLSHMFTASAPPRPTLSCPKCRHPSTLGNSVLSLPKNYSLLPILSSDDDDDDDSGDESDSESVSVSPSRCRGAGGGGGGTGVVRSLCSDHEMRLVKAIGEERWLGELRKVSKRCRHKVVVKRVEVGDVADCDWVEGELEKLRLASVWCRNVCAFHGVVREKDHLCLVMERCYGSVQSEMRRSGGRLTLQQILK